MSAPVKDDQYVEYRAACPDHPGNEVGSVSIVGVARAGLAGPCCRIEQRIDDGEWVPVEECGACSATGWLPISAPVPGPVVNEVAEALAARANRDTDEPQHPRLRARTGDYLSMAEAILEMPQVRAAFEAQAKLEAAEGLLREAHQHVPQWWPDDLRGRIHRFLEEGGEGS